MSKPEIVPNKPFIYHISFILMLLILVLAIGYFWIASELSPVNENAESILVEIPSNSSTNDIAIILSEEGLIKNETIFKLYARLSGYDTNLKAGEYLLSSSLSSKEILEKISSGEVNLNSFTIPEGYNVEQIASHLSSQGHVDKEEFIYLVNNGDFDFPYLDDLSNTKYRLEGFLFPDTYRIPSTYNEEQIIQLMLDRFMIVFDEDLKEKVEELNITPVEAVTLASIIEKEIMVISEMDTVSAVFHNRLERGMLLQSCATVHYAMGEVKEVLLNEDLRTQSPYNTYLSENMGLPPGPIASPGEAALRAAVSPADVEYLYFVAKGDGFHHFSTTLAEHNAAKARYLN